MNEIWNRELDWKSVKDIKIDLWIHITISKINDASFIIALIFLVRGALKNSKIIKKHVLENIGDT